MTRYTPLLMIFALLPVVDRAWAAEPPKPRATLEGHDKTVWSVAFTADSKTLASGGDDETARLWDAGTGKQKAVFKPHPHHVRSVAITPNGKALVAGCWDGTVHIWETATGKEKFVLDGHDASVGSMALTSDGKTLAAVVKTGTSDKTLKLWDAETGKAKTVIGQDSGHARAVAFRRLHSRVKRSRIDSRGPRSSGALLVVFIGIPFCGG